MLFKEWDFIMGVLRSFKKNNLMGVSIIDKVESTIRHWPEAMNKKLLDLLTKSLPLAYYLHFLGYRGHEKEQLLVQSEASEKVYSRLKNQVGEETYVGEWYTINQDCIDQFANVTGDLQWIHTDPSRAKKESPFRTTISHGFLTLALIPMLTDSVDPDKNHYPEARIVVNNGLNRVLFPSPVKVGKRIRARTRVINLTPMKKGLEIVREVRIEIENSTRPACIAEVVLRLYF